MKLVIHTSDAGFVKVFIPGVLKSAIKKYYRPSKAIKLNQYLRSLNILMTVEELMIYAVENLTAIKSNDDYILEVDKNLSVPNMRISLDTAVKIVTFGTIDIKGYDILKKAFDFVDTHINILKKVYIRRKARKEESHGNKFNR